MTTTFREGDKTLWVRSNWDRLTGLPLPDYDNWMLSDTPLTRSALEMLKSNNLVERAGTERRKVSPGKFTQQMTYRTTRHDSVFDRIDRSAAVPRDVAETFAARPECDVYVVDVFTDASLSRVAADVLCARDEHDVDVQLVGVGPVEPDEYPGRFVEASGAELTDASSTIVRAIPARPDVLSVSMGVQYSVAAARITDESDATHRLVNPEPGWFVDVVQELTRDGVDDSPAPRCTRKTRPDDDRQRMLSHFDPNVVVEGDVELDGGENGQATLTGLVPDGGERVE